ncbi:hypothetical protein [Armatimonas sp.]|uniref:hypothetical protein n=1 Tax=Armatimonas sp. TaxID=1872638 RepID=UPI00286D13BE|nr:hypothetical protein [Armatimonas sp.]
MSLLTVLVKENSDTDAEPRLLGRYLSCEEAIAACKRRVDESLAELYTPGMSAETLFQHFSLFGEEAFVAGVDFSSWDYARSQSAAFAGVSVTRGSLS